MGRPRKAVKNLTRVDVPKDADAWDGDIPLPNSDRDDDAMPEWLWSRGIPELRVEHEITVPEVRAVLDAHRWEWWCRTGDSAPLMWAEYQPSNVPRPVGSEHHAAIFTEAEVGDMREWYQAGFIRVQDVATKYACSWRAASQMLRGLTWAHVE